MGPFAGLAGPQAPFTSCVKAFIRPPHRLVVDQVDLLGADHPGEELAIGDVEEMLEVGEIVGGEGGVMASAKRPMTKSSRPSAAMPGAEQLLAPGLGRRW